MTTAEATFKHLTDWDYPSISTTSTSATPVWVDSQLNEAANPSNCSEEADWFDAALDRLQELLNLPENWDSYGAPQIKRSLIEEAIGFMGEVRHETTAMPSIVPTVKGGIQLEWHLGQIDLEVEIEEPAKFNAFYEDLREGEEWELDQSRALTKIREALRCIEHRTKSG